MSKELWIFNHHARTGEDAGGAWYFEMAKHLNPEDAERMALDGRNVVLEH